MAQLRERHRAAWHELGSPHAACAGWTFTTLSFLLVRRFERLGDPRLSAAAGRFRTGFLLWVGGGIAFVFRSSFSTLVDDKESFEREVQLET